MRSRLTALLLGALALVAGLPGCKVVVLGDSNSCVWEDGCREGDVLMWPGRMTLRPTWPGWRIVDVALPNMTAGDYGPADVLPGGTPASGRWHLERAIREQLADACEPVPGRGVVRRKLVIALGTNDVVRPGVSGAAAGLAVWELYDRARRVPCVDVYVATLPPRLDAPPGAIAQANAVIRLTVPAARIVPFDAQPVTDLDASGVHMVDRGYQRRADLAFPVLFPDRPGRRRGVGPVHRRHHRRNLRTRRDQVGMTGDQGVGRRSGVSGVAPAAPSPIRSAAARMSAMVRATTEKLSSSGIHRSSSFKASTTA